MLSRTRLFSQLDEGCKGPLIWVAGPPGAGKTTLVSSYLEARRRRNLWYQMDEGDADVASFFHYLGLAAKEAAPRYRTLLPHLTQEYLSGLPVFARRYFEALAARLKPPCILTFDNYQEVPADSVLHGVLCEGCAALPRDFTVIVISRTDPPPAQARSRANGGLTLIGWEDLRLTETEAEGIAQLRKPKPLPPGDLASLYEKTRGWAAGLTLLLEQGKSGRLQEVLQDSGDQTLFDYFAGEIFNRMDAAARRVLLLSCFLSRMTGAMAQQLTGLEVAGSILADLHEKNYFVLRRAPADPVYEYHPLFREFLLARAQLELTSAQLVDTRKRAGAILESVGQAEEAAMLYAAAEDWERLERLVIRQAGAVLREGRHRTLESWLALLPAQRLERSGWLCYWRGVCRLAFDPTSARIDLENAYRLFQGRGELAAQLQAWCAVIETVVYESHDFKPMLAWTTEVEELLAAAAPLPPSLMEQVSGAMFIALSFTQPQHVRRTGWLERIADVIQNSNDLSLRIKVAPYLLIHYTWYSGDIAKAELLVNSLREIVAKPGVPPLAQITCHAMSAAYYWVIAENTACTAAVNRGLEIAEASGVHLWDMMLCSQGIFATLFGDQPALAEPYFVRISAWIALARRVDQAWYHYLISAKCFFQGDIEHALRYCEQSVRLNTDVGSVIGEVYARAELGRLMFYAGDPDRAAGCMRELRADPRNSGCAGVQYLTYLAEAEFALVANDEAGCVGKLRTALSIARQHRIQTRTWWHARTMARLYAVALEHDIEMDYVCALVRKRKLVAPDENATERWPYFVKITALGRFAILKQDAPLMFTGKVQRKPLELLKVLIALGGRNVPEERLSEILWPDSDGDTAHKAFATTLHRLRKLMGNEQVLRLDDRRLTLDAGHVWLDTWAFERLLDQAETNGDAGSPEARHSRTRIERGLNLYGGAFLEHDGASWVLPLRERLRSKFLRYADRLGRALEQAGQWQQAADRYQKGLEVDPLAEEFYRRLMLCHWHLQRSAEAIGVYRRCRQVLSTMLSVPPAAETQALYQRIRDSLGAPSVGS